MIAVLRIFYLKVVFFLIFLFYPEIVSFELPHLSSIKLPYKIKPENVEGRKFDHTDKLVYDIVPSI